MKARRHTIMSLAGIALVMPATADVIYSNLQDISIPANFAGVYLNIETGAFNNDINAPQSGWDINAFFGGSVLWNSPSFQPVRSGTGELDAVLNLASGTMVNSSSTYSTFLQGPTGENPNGPGYGGSQTHMGAGAGQFTSGTSGYVGFKLNGSNYGWMRVEFTNNTSGALIKEWAYTNDGAAIATGNIVRSGANVTVDSALGNFTVGSIINNSSGTTNLVKSSTGTVTLSAANTYTGTTTVNAGKLVVNGNQSGATGAVSVASGATLAGTGTVGGATTISGSHAAGDIGTVGTQTFSSDLTYSSASIFEWDVTSASSYDKVVAGGTLGGSDAAFNITSSTAYGDVFWDSNQSWTDIFTNSSNVSQAFASIFSSITGTGITWNSSLQRGEVGTVGPGGTGGYFTISGSSLNWTAVPETSNVLICTLVGAGLLRRRRLA